jgi:hypothetical protein
MPSSHHRWRRTAGASVALFLAALALMAGRVRAGADPALGPASSSTTTTTTTTTTPTTPSDTSSADDAGATPSTDDSDPSSSADLPTTGAS